MSLNVDLPILAQDFGISAEHRAVWHKALVPFAGAPEGAFFACGLEMKAYDSGTIDNDIEETVVLWHRSDGALRPLNHYASTLTAHIHAHPAGLDTFAHTSLMATLLSTPKHPLRTAATAAAAPFLRTLLPAIGPKEPQILQVFVLPGALLLANASIHTAISKDHYTLSGPTPPQPGHLLGVVDAALSAHERLASIANLTTMLGGWYDRTPQIFSQHRTPTRDVLQGATLFHPRTITAPL